MDMMKQYFHTEGKTTLFFKDWKIITWEELAVSLVFIISITICGEVCRAYQTFLAFSLRIQRKNIQSNTLTKKTRIVRHTFATFVYILQLIFSYLVMLSVMTYQFYILITVLLGVGIGYYLSQPLILKRMETLRLKVGEKTLNLGTEENRNEILSEEFALLNTNI